MTTNICPKCNHEIERLSKGKKCPSCKATLERIDNYYVLESEKRIPETLLQSYEMNVSRVCPGLNFKYFQKGRVRAAQLAYAANFFLKTKEFLLSQPETISATPESFSLMVMAEIMTDDFSRRTQSMHGLEKFILNACKNVYLSKLNEKRETALYHSIDLSPAFDVMQL